MKVIQIVFALFFTISIYASSIKMQACPGEGPHPFSLSDISSQLPKPQILPTSGHVKDFVVSEPNQSIYYRNQSSKVYEMDLGTKENLLLTRSNLPLSKVIDDEGRYLMTQKSNFVFDMFGEYLGWKNMGVPVEGSITPLYWKHFLLPIKRDVFYEIANWRDRITGKQRLTVYSYVSGRWHANQCDLSNIRGTLKIGSGHFDPNVFLYETESSFENTKLTLWNINIAGPIFTCKPTLAYKYIHTIPGQVRSVSQFSGSKMFAVRTTDRERNLIWTNKEDNKGCRYLNFGERESFVVSNHQPVIAAWGKFDGLTFIYPNEEKRATLFPGSQNFPIKKEHVWMSDEGDSLISALHSGNDLYDLYQQKL